MGFTNKAKVGALLLFILVLIIMNIVLGGTELYEIRTPELSLLDLEDHKQYNWGARILDLSTPSPPASELLWLVGIEGSSHHGVSQILRNLGIDRCRAHSHGEFELSWMKENSTCLSEEPVEPCPYHYHRPVSDFIFHERGSHHDYRKRPTILRRRAILELLRREAELGPMKLNMLTIQDRSFPFNVEKRYPPWPIDLLHLYHSLSPVMSVRFIVLLRPFEKCVWSHREWDNGTKGHAEVLNTYVEYLAEALDFIPRSQWRMLPVDCMYKDQESRQNLTLRMIDWLNWRPDGKPGCCRCLDDWVGSKQKEIPKEELYKIKMKENQDAWGIFKDGSYAENREQFLADPDTCR